ncbi:substrate-binding domain-containing protein [bacterium]|nr:substrate-binding domain-containing protein [bacterium]
MTIGCDWRLIDNLTQIECDCAIIVANDDDVVRQAVARALAKGLPIITLVSDLPQSKRRCFVGIDNEAAGRTAASLLGRFCSAGAKIGLVVGSLDLRDHRDRFIGFNEVMLDEYPNVELVGPVEGFDDTRETARRVNELLTDNHRLAGIYSIGAGNEGLLHTLKQRVNPNHLRVVAHELTDATRNALEFGYIDAVLHQNPVEEARKALEQAQKLVLSNTTSLDRTPIETGIYMRDNLPAQTPQKLATKSTSDNGPDSKSVTSADENA